MTNTNKLVKFYRAATAARRAIRPRRCSVCLQPQSAATRELSQPSSASKTENSGSRTSAICSIYSFKAFENEVVVRKGENIGKTVKVEKGKQAEVDVYADENVSVFKKRAGDDNVEIVYELSDSVKPRKTRRRRGKRQNCEERSRHKNRRTQSRGQRRQGKLLRRDTTYPFKLVKKTLYKPSSRVVKKVFY